MAIKVSELQQLLSRRDNRGCVSGWVEVKKVGGSEYLYFRQRVGRRKVSRYLGKKSELGGI